MGFYEGFFWDRVSQTICLGWLWTMILLIFASWAARIYRHEILASSINFLFDMLVAEQKRCILTVESGVLSTALWNKLEAEFGTAPVTEVGKMQHSCFS
jgi:hypothetical protein